MAMNVVAKRSENERVRNALFELALVPSGNEAGVETMLEFVLGAGVGKSTPVGVVPVVLASRVHSPVPSPPDTMLQYASNPLQVLVQPTITSHSSKGAMLEAA